MRRILLAAAVVLSLLSMPGMAQARWGHHCGWGGGWGGCGWGGYRSCGWGGGWGCGWGGNNCFSPVFVGGFARPYWTGFYPGYGGFCSPYFNGFYGNSFQFYGRPIGIGYLSSYSPQGTYYNDQTNFVNYYAPAGGTIVSNTQPAIQTPVVASTDSLRNYLDLKSGLVISTTIEPTGMRITTISSTPKPTAVTPSLATTPRTPAVRISSAEQRLKADQYMAQGDILFKEQKFHSALQKYKLAAAAAPDMPEAFWREGHALIATSNFDLAAGAFKRAIAIDPDTRRSGFTLDKLYGTASMAKNAHQETLAAWALEHADSSNSYFLVGVTLAYDRQTERAARFFGKAAELAGVSGGHIAVFTPGAAIAAPLAARPAPVVPVSAKLEL